MMSITLTSTTFTSTTFTSIIPTSYTTLGKARPMADSEYEPVRVSRRIGAPAHEIFQVLADPRRHREIDGSGMLRGAATERPVSAVGDVFVMRMHFSRLGDYEMNNHVVEFEPDRLIGWEPAAGAGHPDAPADGSAEGRWGQRWSYELTPDGPDATLVTEIYDCSRAPANERAGLDGGRVWIGGMTSTLERLEAVCTGAVAAE
jgi:hypothetical protein